MANVNFGLSPIGKSIELVPLRSQVRFLSPLPPFSMAHGITRRVTVTKDSLLFLQQQMITGAAVVVRMWYEPGASATTTTGMMTVHFRCYHNLHNLCELAPCRFAEPLQ